MTLKYWSDFFDDLEHIRGRSLNTILAYRRDLEIFLEFQKTSNDIIMFYEFMKKKGLSSRSQARCISSLRTYFKFCESRGEKAPELRDLKLPKVKLKLPQSITIGDFNLLLRASQVEDPIRSSRNQLTLLLLFGIGCRVSELIFLNLKDFNQMESWLKVVGKGQKERLVPLTQMLMKSLVNYLENIRPSLNGNQKTQSIIINDRGNRPSRVDIWRWMDAWSKKAGFEETIHPHLFRHGFATQLLESGVDLKTIQVLLGHSSLQTTQIYTSVTAQHLEETVEKHHLLSKLDDI